MELQVDISFELINVDGVTKRRVENDAGFDDDWIGCKAVITSDFGTAENVRLPLFISVESRASRLFGWCGSTLSLLKKVDSKTNNCIQWITLPVVKQLV